MKHWIIIFICLICLMFAGFATQTKPVGAAGNTYYVATTGLDSNDGSLTHPWLTINHAASVAVAGDMVYVRTGIYHEYVFDCYHSGASGNPITFENYPGESPVIDGTGLANPSNNYGQLSIFNVSYVNWQGFEIRNSQNYEGVYALHASHINLSNLKIHAITQSGIALGDVSYMVIDTCELYNCNTIPIYDETIIMSPAQNIEVKNSYIHDTASAGVDIRGAIGDSGCNNISIHNNEICNLANGSSGIYIDMQGMNQSGFSIYSNKIHNVGNGITLGSEVSPATLTNTNIYNNLIYNNTYGFQAQPYSFPKTVSIINNTFYNNAIGIDWDDAAANYQVNCVVRNNIIVSSTTYSLIHYDYYAQGGVTIDHNLFYDAVGYNTQYGTNYVIGNPLLNNPGTDFSIPANSPAIDAGFSTNAPSTDYIGTSRPQGSGYDIGAYEYKTVPGTPPTVTSTPPIAQNDAYSTPENTALSIAAPGVLANDSDADLKPLTVFKVTNPFNGKVTLNANGSFTYNPNTGYVGTDTFSYGANDSSTDSHAATVTITVFGTPATVTNTSPIVQNAAYSTPENTALSVPAPGVLANATDAALRPLTAFKVTGPVNGTLTLNANGSFTYNPNAGYVGTDTFTYGANDGSSDSHAATVTVTVY